MEDNSIGNTGAKKLGLGISNCIGLEEIHLNFGLNVLYDMAAMGLIT